MHVLSLFGERRSLRCVQTIFITIPHSINLVNHERQTICLKNNLQEFNLKAGILKLKHLKITLMQSSNFAENYL